MGVSKESVSWQGRLFDFDSDLFCMNCGSKGLWFETHPQGKVEAYSICLKCRYGIHCEVSCGEASPYLIEALKEGNDVGC